MDFFANNRKVQKYLPFLVLALFSILLFINTTGGDFTYDDYPLIVNNKSIQSFHFTDIWKMGNRPLRTLSLMIDYRLFGLNPQGYHIQNILWHTASVLLLYILFLRLTSDKVLSFMGALLFAVHPIHVEAVANIANRKEAICMVFALLSFLFYMNFCERRRRHYGVWFVFSLFTFYLALHAKQVIIVLPVIFIVYEYLFLPEDKRFILKNKSVLLITAATLLLVVLFSIYTNKHLFDFENHLFYRGTFHGYSGEPTAHNMLLTIPKPFVQYIKLLIFPFALSPAHSIELFTSPLHLEVVASWLFFLFFLTLPFIFVRKNRLLAFALFWFVINYVPISNVIPISYYLADRYMYIPSAAACLIMAWIMRQTVLASPAREGYKKRQLICIFLVVSIVVLYSVKTIAFNAVWSNRVKLWSYDVKVNPESYKAYTNRGAAYSDLGYYEKALQDFSKAIHLYPDVFEAYNNRGTVYTGLGLYEEAVKDFTRAVEINPEAEDCFSNRGNAYLYWGKYESAIKDYSRAIELKSDSYRAYYNRGLAYYNLGNNEEAIKNYNKSIEINPDFERVYNNRGNLLNRLGDLKGAIRDYSRAIELNSQYETAYFNRALTYLKSGDSSNAERDLLTIISMNRKNAQAYYKLGMIYMEKSDMDKARSYLRQAADLGYKKALNVLPSP